MKLPRQASLILLGPALVAAAIGLGLYLVRPFESPADRAYRLCGECGIEAREVDAFVESKRRSTLSRQQELDSFRELFKKRGQAEWCEPCANAVLDAAGR